MNSNTNVTRGKSEAFQEGEKMAKGLVVIVVILVLLLDFKLHQDCAGGKMLRD